MKRYFLPPYPRPSPFRKLILQDISMSSYSDLDAQIARLRKAEKLEDEEVKLPLNGINAKNRSARFVKRPKKFFLPSKMSTE